MAISETFIVSKEHNPIAEMMSMTETVYVRALNYGVIFVTDDYVPNLADPNDTKRSFFLDSSPIG